MKKAFSLQVFDYVLGIEVELRQIIEFTKTNWNEPKGQDLRSKACLCVGEVHLHVFKGSFVAQL